MGALNVGVLRIYQSSIGKKVIMAVTGLVWIGQSSRWLCAKPTRASRRRSYSANWNSASPAHQCDHCEHQCE